MTLTKIPCILYFYITGTFFTINKLGIKSYKITSQTSRCTKKGHFQEICHFLIILSCYKNEDLAAFPSFISFTDQEAASSKAKHSLGYLSDTSRSWTNLASLSYNWLGKELFAFMSLLRCVAKGTIYRFFSQVRYTNAISSTLENYSMRIYSIPQVALFYTLMNGANNYKYAHATCQVKYLKEPSQQCVKIFLIHQLICFAMV